MPSQTPLGTFNRLNTDSTTVGAALLGVTRILGVVDALESLGAFESSNTATELGSAITDAIGSTVIRIALVIWVIDADFVGTGALATLQATAFLHADTGLIAGHAASTARWVVDADFVSRT